MSLTLLSKLMRMPCIAALVLRCGAVGAQTVNWVTTQSPSPRAGMGMSYDWANNTMVLFGGADNAHNIVGDTWIWQDGWIQQSPQNTPSPRSNSAMAFDGAEIVLFGGNDASGTYLNDTWTWDGTNWTQQFPPTSPSARAAIMTYHAANGTVVLFGGTGSSSVLGDTWTWNGASKTWTQQQPPSSPSPRFAPMAYDGAARSLVLFGGNGNGGTEFTDTWTWDGINWTQQHPTVSPTPRTSAGMAYDAGFGAIVLFGGYNGSWPNSLDDTWVWNGTNWKQIHPATTPANRYAFGMDYDGAAKALMMFSGYSSGPARAGTWFLAIVP